jgi:hypothetical protein
MYKEIITVATLVGTIVLLSSGVDSDNGKAGKTGSPSELNCRDCHDSYALNSGGGSVNFTCSNMSPWEYMPGTTYHMTATVAKTNMPLFGIGLEALTSANQNAGTLTVTNNSTQIKTATVSGVVRKNLVHTLNGGATANSKAFNFDWVAPSTNIGPVTFYYAGVAANGDGNESVGDYVYTGSQVVNPMMSTGIAEASSTDEVKIFPTPTNDLLNVEYTLTDAATVSASLYDVEGRMVQQLISAERQPGRHSERISGLSSHADGTYIVRLALPGHSIAKRLVISNTQR